VLVAEALDVVAELGHRGRSSGSGQPRSDHEDGVLALVGGVDQLHLEAVRVPLPLDRTGGDVRFQIQAASSGHRTIPASTASGNEMLPITMMMAKIQAPARAA